MFYSYRCEYYINTSCGMTQIKDTSISFISEQCHVCYHYLASLTSSYRDMTAGCSFNCTAPQHNTTAYVGQTEVWCQIEVEPVCNMSLRDINVSQCWEGQRTRSDYNPMFPQQRFPHILDTRPANIRGKAGGERFNKVNPHHRDISPQQGVEHQL